MKRRIFFDIVFICSYIKYEYRNFKLRKFMILSDNRKWIILYGS